MFKVVEKRGQFLFLQEINKYNYVGKSMILNLQSMTHVQKTCTKEGYPSLSIGHINIDMTDMKQFYDMITGPDKVFILTGDINMMPDFETKNYNLVDDFPTNETDFIDLLLDKYKTHQLLEYVDQLLKIGSNLMEINNSSNDYKKKIGNQISQIIIKFSHKSGKELKVCVIHSCLLQKLQQSFNNPHVDKRYGIQQMINYLRQVNVS